MKTLYPSTAPTVTVELEGKRITVAAHLTVAAAVLSAGITFTRTTPVSGAPRAPYCMMGVCFECLMEIDGEASRQACMIRVREGMRIRRQQGARGLEHD